MVPELSCQIKEFAGCRCRIYRVTDRPELLNRDGPVFGYIMFCVKPLGQLFSVLAHLVVNDGFLAPQYAPTLTDSVALMPMTCTLPCSVSNFVAMSSIRYPRWSSSIMCNSSITTTPRSSTTHFSKASLTSQFACMKVSAKIIPWAVHYLGQNLFESAHCNIDIRPFRAAESLCSSEKACDPNRGHERALPSLRTLGKR